jgi:hypothetical protein
VQAIVLPISDKVLDYALSVEGGLASAGFRAETDRRQEKIDSLDSILLVIDEVIAQQECFSLKELAVNGRDLIDAGLAEGAAIGVMLNKLLDMVIEEQIENDKARLLEAAVAITDANKTDASKTGTDKTGASKTGADKTGPNE